MFDQVIIRPKLISAFEEDSLCIITETTNHNLLKKDKPNADNYSDHLPIFFNFNEVNIS